MLLALDPSTNCGWALCEPFSGRPRMRVGSWKLRPGTNFERAAEIAERVGRMVLEEKVERVAIEIPMSAPPRPKKQIKKTALGFESQMVVQGNISTQNLLWALHGGIAGSLQAAGVRGHIVGLKEWRKHTLGDGNILGDESKARCRALLARLDIYCPNNDAAEAGGILFWLNSSVGRFRIEDQLRARSAA